MIARRVVIWRVRWRFDHWNTTTSGRSRLFVHGRYATQFAGRMEARGADVEVSVADTAVQFDEVTRWRA